MSFNWCNKPNKKWYFYIFIGGIGIYFIWAIVALFTNDINSFFRALLYLFLVLGGFLEYLEVSLRIFGIKFRAGVIILIVVFFMSIVYIYVFGDPFIKLIKQEFLKIR